jgi:hypothetical protein
MTSTLTRWAIGVMVRDRDRVKLSFEDLYPNELGCRG